MKRIFIFLALFSIFFCNVSLSDEIGYGEITKDIYTNGYFNMSIPVPGGWHVQSKAAMKELSNVGTNMLAGEDNNLRIVLKESEKQSVNMFGFFKHEPGAPVNFNPSILSVAERVTHMPGIKKGSDYLFHVKNIFQTGQMNYTFPKEMFSKSISGISFDVMPTEARVGNKVVYQEYYAARIKNYVLSFVVTYSSDSEKGELNSILNNLSFSKQL
jgi:hypothetical protein